MADITITDREQNSMLVNIGLVCLGTAAVIAGYEVYVNWTNQSMIIFALCLGLFFIHMPKETLYEKKEEEQ